MARYYFHFWTGDRYEVDDVGVDFADFERAYLDAHATVHEMADDRERSNRDPKRLGFEIVDARGHLLLSLPFAEVLNGDAYAELNSKRGELDHTMSRQRLLRRDLTAMIATARATLQRSRALLERSRAQFGYRDQDGRVSAPST